ncbi:abnormal spindle-like microcephaly-associated protein homolog isoform X2 [Morus notabilis]|uniref:abnormal spindle-like microcephaly-associated protein homolog isoform X2 n=1 Tax=Morus notabilis TaxID=981085 RepID=UPI000CED7805|nr:abnormal spindle-like microcephaly-associated protein homolog isoform X2 [Morus notabilis]
MEDGEPPCPSLSPYRLSSSSSSIFRDISNFKTPKRPAQKLNLQSPSTQFFTASKQTPWTSWSTARRRPALAPPSSRARTVRRLKALEFEQSQSSRKSQIQKERSLKSLAKSITVWLNFLFENPGSCGCDLSTCGGNVDRSEVATKGKRDSFPGIGVRVDAAWRNPKRQRDSAWRAEDAENIAGFSNSAYLSLQNSLKDVCSFEDLKKRMRVYLNLGGCKEVFDVMTQVAKNIDQGRLKMKAHCPLVTDVGLKEKAIRILMCYNPTWLRIGLYIVFGGDSLLSNGDVDSDQETAFLKMIFEKQFFSHGDLAKAYAYNKMVEGLYRPGYYETLGNIVLKRFLLLVLVLDRAKCQSSLSQKYGIDGKDGGSPLLFTVQSSIKSSRQVIHDFLSPDIMLGEGNILAHLMIVGYKVPYQQSALAEYDFQVSDLFVDLQDGVRLCRATHLLLDDPSILAKLAVPSDTRKKCLVNCGVVMQYLSQAGAALYDDDGVMIVGDDVANGDKELTLSLLWNMFVHLQLPLLMKRTMLAEEICKIRGANVDHFNTSSSTPLEMLLSWIQAICQNYDCKIDNFSSLVDGKGIWCLLDYYFRKELPCTCSSKDSHRSSGEESIVLVTDYPDAVHNFLLSQRLTTLLGNFPEISDILEYSGACNDRSVVILLVFLASKLIVKKNLDQLNFHKLLGCNCQSPVRKYSSAEPCFSSPDLVRTKDKTYGYSTEDAARKFKAIQAWWRAMTERSYQRIAKPEASPILYHLTTTKNNIKNQRENAAKVIQSHFKRALKRRDYLKMLHAASLLQTVFRAWLTVKKKPSCINFTAMQDQKSSFERWKQSETWRRYVMFIIERHCFVKLKKSVLLIQRAARNWITRRRLDDRSIETSEISAPDLVNASIVIQKYLRGWLARSGYICEVAQVQKVFVLQPKEDLDDLINASIVIQKYLRRWLTRSRFLCEVAQKERTFNLQPKKSVDDLISASIIIQKYLRGWFVRCRHIREVAQIEKAFHLSLEKGVDDLQTIEEVEVQLTAKCSVICNSIKNQHFAATKIQSHFRCLILRRGFQSQKHATLKIQSYFRMSRCLKTYQHHKALTKSATIIQSFVRQWICHREACRRRDLIDAIQRHCRGWLVRREFLSQREAVIKIQSAVRGLKCRMGLHRQTLAALEIQRFVRGQLTRKKLLGTSSQRTLAPNGHISRSSRGCNRSSELTLVLYSVGKLQRWWRGVLSLKLKMRCALIIQSRFRGWIAIRKTTRERHHIVVIQSHWKGYLARKESRGHLLDLRLRMQQSAANVDDGMRIINRLIAALSELLSKKSISGILHTCATLDMATRYSKKCCEKLVDAGAISTLLKLIRSVSRSIPDQEVVKHSLSTLRNLARYPHLVEVLIDCHGSIEIILWELLRNKEEIYFIASEVLKKICSSRKGIEAVRKSPAVLRRLHNLVEELSRKAHNEKRGVRGQMARENTDRRLREAVSLLKMVTEG